MEVPCKLSRCWGEALRNRSMPWRSSKTKLRVSVGLLKAGRLSREDTTSSFPAHVRVSPIVFFSFATRQTVHDSFPTAFTFLV